MGKMEGPSKEIEICEVTSFSVITVTNSDANDDDIDDEVASDENSSNDNTNVGAIVGGAVGGFVILGSAAAGGFFLLRRYSRPENPAGTKGSTDVANRVDNVNDADNVNDVNSNGIANFNDDADPNGHADTIGLAESAGSANIAECDGNAATERFIGTFSPQDMRSELPSPTDAHANSSRQV